MITQIAILVILIGLNAFFAASEIAFIALNDTKIEKQAKEGNKKAKQIKPLFPKYRNIAVLKVIDGQITSDSIVELF